MQEPSKIAKTDVKKLRKARNKIVNNRVTLKRKALLSKMSNKVINHVSRRTRSGVSGRRSVCNFSTIRKVQKTKHNNSASKEISNLVGKFVLPSRSIHSSRVIKPNKRFINVETSECNTFKKRVSNKRLCDSDEKCKINDNSKETRDSVRTLCSSSENDINASYSKGKVVLRQARLQLNSHITSGPEGPFSCNNNTANVSPPGTVTCGVCGAVRFYRFVKQARKFNIYSCESCRKFISKMIKRQNNMNSMSTPTLICHKGQGICHVPPIVRSPQWKLFRCAYKARCPACWLKMCLRSFQMPTVLKNSLIQLLPKYMQSKDMLFSSSLPLLSWEANVDNTVENSSKNDPEEAPIRRRPLRVKPVKEDVKLKFSNTSEIRRQKIDFKGPRVKHVCRSASIVLGQPLAIFPDLSKKNDIDTSDEKGSKSVNKENKFASTKESCRKGKIEDFEDSVNTQDEAKFSHIIPMKSEPLNKKEKILKNNSSSSITEVIIIYN